MIQDPPVEITLKDSFALAVRSLRDTFPKVFKASSAWIFIWFLPLQLLGQYFGWASDLGDDRLRLIGSLGSALVGLACSSILLLVVPAAVVRTRFPPQTQTLSSRPRAWPHFKKHIGPLAIESMRMLPKGLMLTCLLIVPGLYYFLRMSFLPYLVQFSSNYERGQVDVLPYSMNFSKGRIMILLLLGVATLLVQLATTYSMAKVSVIHEPFSFALMFVVSVPLSMAVEVVWTSVFLKIFEGVGDELVLPVE